MQYFALLDHCLWFAVSIFTFQSVIDYHSIIRMKHFMRTFILVFVD